MTSWSDVTARPGLCTPACSRVIVYAVVIFLATFSFSLSMAPDTVVNFRSVFLFCFTFVIFAVLLVLPHPVDEVVFDFCSLILAVVINFYA